MLTSRLQTHVIISFIVRSRAYMNTYMTLFTVMPEQCRNWSHYCYDVIWGSFISGWICTRIYNTKQKFHRNYNVNIYRKSRLLAVSFTCSPIPFILLVKMASVCIRKIDVCLFKCFKHSTVTECSSRLKYGLAYTEHFQIHPHVMMCIYLNGERFSRWLRADLTDLEFIFNMLQKEK